MTEAPMSRSSFWAARASLGGRSGTDDLIAKQIEMRAILSLVKPGMRVLDAGCGTGETAAGCAAAGAHVSGFDASPAMIDRATAEWSNRVDFRVGDLLDPPFSEGQFDLIYTERALINLMSWHEQRHAIARLRLLAKTFAMVENSKQGLEGTNALRRAVGLPEIVAPWHNRYLDEEELQTLGAPEPQHITSTYAFLSRVANAWLAHQAGEAPDYQAPVNRLALSLPNVGTLGQTKMWLWE